MELNGKRGGSIVNGVAAMPVSLSLPRSLGCCLLWLQLKPLENEKQTNGEKKRKAKKRRGSF